MRGFNLLHEYVNDISIEVYIPPKVSATRMELLKAYMIYTV